MLNRKKEEEAPPANQQRGGPAVGFGTSFAVGMAVFALGGHWLDKKTGRESFFTLIGIGLGLLYGAWELWKLIAMTNEQAKREAKNKEQPPDAPLQ
ncbi:AtpZ/AtpI family protein [Pontiellaceae bacterium B1224]|nr:AtpZ/AtpI family protein [Pontiellaceae bacterium B1224]